MSIKMMVFFAFTFFVASFICLMIEGSSYFGSTDVSILNALVGFNVVEMSDLGLLAIPKMAIGFFTVGVPNLILWDYSFLDGAYEIVKWLLLYPLSIGFVWAIISMFVGVIQRSIP